MSRMLDSKGRRARYRCGIGIAMLLACAPTVAGMTESTMRQFVGYTIVAVLTITGYRDADGMEKDSFEGCNFGRTIIFEGNQALKCGGYGYQYAYRPDAV